MQRLSEESIVKSSEWSIIKTYFVQGWLWGGYDTAYFRAGEHRSWCFSDSSFSHWILAHVGLHFQRHWGSSQYLTSVRATWELVSEEKARHCNKKTEGFCLALSPAPPQRHGGDDSVSPAITASPSLLTSHCLLPLHGTCPTFTKNTQGKKWFSHVKRD